MQCVNPPSTRPGGPGAAFAVAVAFAAAWLTLAPATAAAASQAPFTSWLQAVGTSAQRLADGDGAGAAALGERALEVLPRGPATQRARVALGLALSSAGRREEGAKHVAAGANAIDPRIAAEVLAAFSPPSAPAPAAPPRAPPSTPDERVAEAERLVLDARPREALEQLDAISTAPMATELLDRSSLLRAWAYLQLGRRDEAGVLARGILSRPAREAGTRLGAELVLARVAARANRVADAIARYDIISTRPYAPIPGLPASTSRDLAVEAAYLAAWLPFDAGQWARAAEELSRFASERPRSPRAADASWFAAWALFRQGRTAEAREAWAKLERTSLAPGALYWQARLSPAARARKLYRRAIDAEPGGWYAFLAAGRLRALGVHTSALPPGAAAPVLDEPAGAAAPLSRATALLELGLRDAAVAELRGASSGARARGAAAHVAELADAAGEAELTMRIARDLLPLSRRSLRWQHPLAYGAGLDALATSAGVDPLLFRALIRRESTFRRDARSPAGAEGLVQLMPYTADRLVALLGAPADGAPDLRDPATSLSLGATYLGLLSDRFREPVSVLAAYNGGPIPAAAWSAANAGRPIDEAVEELPYRETRRYVKIVMAAYATYRHLYGGAPASLDGAHALTRPREGVRF